MRRIVGSKSVKSEGVWVLVIGHFRAVVKARKGRGGGIWYGEVGECREVGYGSRVLDWLEETVMKARGFQ